MVLERRGRIVFLTVIARCLARGLVLEDLMHMVRYSLSTYRASAPFTSTMASARNVHIFKASPWAEGGKANILSWALGSPALVAWSWKDIANMITLLTHS